VPAIYVEHLTPSQIEALALAENRVSEEASWSPETLTLIMRDLSLDLDFDLSLTAFDTAEIDLSLLGPEGLEPDEPEDGLEPPSRDKPPISRIGDVWRIGLHLVVCGDALKAATYAPFGEERAELVIADSPYNVRVNGHVSGTGRHAEFPMASGEMSLEEFIQFLSSACRLMAEHSTDGSLHFLFMDFRHMRELLAAGHLAYSELINLCVWVKRNAGMGSLYRSQHELVFLFKAGTAPHINNIQLGKYGRNRTNVWQYAGANSFGRDRDAMLERHATSKPIDLVADAIMDCSHRGGLVLDPFLGSGTTLLAAQRTGRRGRGIELDPWYVDMAVQRLAAETGLPAIHVASGLTFDTLAAARRSVSSGDDQ
jgi:DNA modification methylase